MNVLRVMRAASTAALPHPQPSHTQKMAPFWYNRNAKQSQMGSPAHQRGRKERTAITHCHSQCAAYEERLTQPGARQSQDAWIGGDGLSARSRIPLVVAVVREGVGERVVPDDELRFMSIGTLNAGS